MKEFNKHEQALIRKAAFEVRHLQRRRERLAERLNRFNKEIENLDNRIKEIDEPIMKLSNGISSVELAKDIEIKTEK